MFVPPTFVFVLVTEKEKKKKNDQGLPPHWETLLRCSGISKEEVIQYHDVIIALLETNERWINQVELLDLYHEVDEGYVITPGQPPVPLGQFSLFLDEHTQKLTLRNHRKPVQHRGSL